MRIILFHDNLLVRTAVTQFCLRLGHQIQCLEPTTSATNVVAAAPPPPNLVIAGTCGCHIDLINSLQALHVAIPATPVFLIAPGDSIPDSAAALQAGIFAYLHHPLQLRELELLLHRLPTMPRQTEPEPLRRAPD